MNTKCEECGIVYQHDKPREVSCVRCNGLLRFKSGLKATALKALGDVLLSAQRKRLCLGLADALAIVNSSITLDAPVDHAEVVRDLHTVGVKYENNKWTVRESAALSGGWGLD